MVSEIWSMTKHEFFVILNHFLPFYPTNNPGNQNFEKILKMPQDIINLQKCTKNHDHMLHCVGLSMNILQTDFFKSRFFQRGFSAQAIYYSPKVSGQAS